MAQSARSTIRTALPIALTLALSACAFPDLPEDSDFALYQKNYRQQAADEFAKLDRDLAAGTLSTADYNDQREALEARVTTQAHEAILRHERLVNQ